MRFPPHGFLAIGPRLTAFLAPLSPAKLSVSCPPFFLSSPWTNFDPTHFCHLRRRSNLLICLLIQSRPNADHDTLTAGRSARDLLQEDRTLAAWSKKKQHGKGNSGPAVCTCAVVTGKSPGDNEQGRSTCVPEWLEMCALVCACLPSGAETMQHAKRSQILYSYRLELKQPSPQARHHTAAYSHIGSETFVQGNLKVRVRTWTLRLP